MPLEAGTVPCPSGGQQETPAILTLLLGQAQPQPLHPITSWSIVLSTNQGIEPHNNAFAALTPNYKRTDILGTENAWAVKEKKKKKQKTQHKK